MAPVTPPHQIIPDYGMNPSPSYSPDPPSITNDSPSSYHHPRNNSLASEAEAHSQVPSDHSSPASRSSNMMPTTTTPTPPFEVPKPWQTAMAMVSINAGLYPQQVLQHYYQHYPLQVAAHPQYTELAMGRSSRRAQARGIRALRVHHAEGDPSTISLLAICLDARDARTQQPLVRLITNTSIRHVLAAPCANCPLWLPVRVATDANPVDTTTTTAAATTTTINGNNNNETTHHYHAAGAVGAKKGAAPGFDSHHPLVPSLTWKNAARPATATTTTTTPYTLIPCCEAWVQSVDFDAPLSNEEKQVPAMVDLLLAEVRRQRVLLRAVQDDEMASLLATANGNNNNNNNNNGNNYHEEEEMYHRHRHHHVEKDKERKEKSQSAAGLVQAALADAEALSWMQYWWAGVALVLVTVMLLFR